MAQRVKLTQADISRVVRGAAAAGVTVDRVEVEGVKVVVYGHTEMKLVEVKPFDSWMANRNAYPA